MATKNKGKGTILAAEISSVYTAIPLIFSIDKSGEASTTYEAKTLDGNVHPDNLNDGYASSPKISFECFWDSGNAAHAFLKTSMRTPPAAGVNFKLTDTAGTPVIEIWNVTGIGIDEKYVTTDGNKATVTLQTTGNPS